MTVPIRKPSSEPRPLLRTPDRRTGGRGIDRSGRRAPSGVQPHLGGRPGTLVAEGTLGSRPLVFLLRDLLDREIEGTLVLVDERDHRHEIDLLAGVPVTLRSDVAIEPLPDTLLSLGLIDKAQRTRLGRHPVVEDELVRHLVERRVVSRALIDRALRHRLMLRLERLLSLGEQTRFLLRRQAVEVQEPRPCNILALLMRGFRRSAHSERAATVLAHLGDRALALRPEADLRYIGLTRTEREVVDGLGAAAATLDELLDLGVGPPSVVRAAVYALAELRFLDLGRTAPPVAAPSDDFLIARPTSAPGRTVLSDPDACMARLERSRPERVAEPEPDELFARAEVAFRRREVDEAEGLLVRICAMDRHHLEARALLAWLRADRVTPPRLRLGQTSMAYAESLDILDGVVREDPSLEKARYWRGQLLKRSGFLREAYNEFKAVVSLNPRNVGAEREVRIFEARQPRLEEPAWRRWLATRRQGTR